jgi:hypothetical protein
MAERVTARTDRREGPAGPPRQAGDRDEAGPADPVGDVADLLRRLREAAAAHDEE